MKQSAKKAVKIGVGLLSLKAKLIAGSITVLAFVLIVLLIGMFQTFMGGSSDSTANEGGTVILPSGAIQLNEKVEGYRDEVKAQAKEEGIKSHTDVLLAMMMQESGGKGNDPFQASESKCGVIGCITSPSESIKQGVKYYSQQLEKAKGDIKLTLQSYNFGGAFISYVLNNGGEYTKELAIQFSSKKYDELKHTGIYSCIHPEYTDEGACYGDVEYVDNVLRYYHPKTADTIASIKPDKGGTNGKWAHPIKGENVTTTSPFGTRVHPISGETKMHTGVDYDCFGGVTPIHSVQDGEVVYSKVSSGYGNTVIVKHGEVFSLYAHLSKRSVGVGDLIKQGTQVGVCGTTGNSTGPHLHLEAQKSMFSEHINPKKMLEGE